MLVIYNVVLVNADVDSAGNMVAFQGYWNLMISPLIFLIGVPSRLIGDFYAAARLRRIMATKPAISDGKGTLEPGQCDVALHHVAVRFGEKTVIEDLSAEFPTGKCTAIMGRSGAGKSTMLDLMLRLRDPFKGTIEIGGKNITNISWKSYVNQPLQPVTLLLSNEIS